MSGEDVDVTNPSTDRDTKYRFFPSVRRGYPPNAYFNGDEQEDADAVETTGTIGVEFEAVGKGGPGPTTEPGSVDIRLYGPEHVTGLDSRQVVRTEPEPGTSNYPPNYFATVEFDAPDMPFLFSPVSDNTLDPDESDPTGKGFPWCCLIVVEKTEERSVTPAGSERPLPSIEVPFAELPPLDEAWAWAHAQVVGSPARKGDDDDGTGDDNEANDDGDNGANDGGLASAFGSESTLTRSRLISPRNLRPNKRYVAAVVPTFAAGVRAGLGEPAKSSGSDSETGNNGQESGEENQDDGQSTTQPMSLAWSVEKTAATGSPAGGKIELPIYHHWEFSTGEKGDFEYLARQLEPRNLSSDEYTVGTRSIDATDPGPASLYQSDDSETEADERIIRMGGALRKADADGIGAEDYPKAKALQKLLNAPSDIQEWTEDDFEAVGPPIYGDRHAQVDALPATFDQDQYWLRDLNLHPGNRMAAAIGAGIVRDNQQQLMDQAWEQVGQVREANRKLGAAQLARAATEATMEDLVDAPTGWLASFTAPAHDRTLVDGRTVGARLDDSSFRRALTTAPFRRLTSGVGRLARRLDGAVDVGDVIEGVADGSLDVVSPGGGPAGVGRTSSTVDVAALCETVKSSNEGDEDDDRPSIVQSLLMWLGEMERQCNRIQALLDDLSAEHDELAPDQHWEEVAALRKLVDRLENEWEELREATPPLGGEMQEVASAKKEGDLPDVSKDFTPNRAEQLHARVAAITEENLLELAGPGDERYLLDASDVAEASADVLALLAALADVEAYLHEDDGSDNAYLENLLCDAVPGDESEEDADLRDAARVDPVPALIERVQSRLGGIDLDAGHRSDPLDRVMAYPEFPKPTYDDLKEVSEQHLLPGVDAVPKNTVGALETNPQFLESFLVGMNQEMASELLWRRYSTDRRGSYFRQFWDASARVPKPSPEEAKDVAELHTWDDKGPDNVGESQLGSNVTTGRDTGSQTGRSDGDGKPNSQIVALLRGELLRRYPTTTIYAAKAKKVDRSKESAQSRVPVWPDPGEAEVDDHLHKYPLFRGALDPDVTFLGFDLTTEEARGETPMPSPGERPDGADEHWVDENGEDDEGWFVVLEEPPGEVRFGLDANQGDIEKTPPGITDANGQTHTTSNPDKNPEHGWSALSWGHLVGSEGDLSKKQNVSVYRDRPGENGWKTVENEPWVDNNDDDNGNDDNDDNDDDSGATLSPEEAAEWGLNGAHMAYITWQRPVRIAIHASDLVPDTSAEEEE